MRLIHSTITLTSIEVVSVLSGLDLLAKTQDLPSEIDYFFCGFGSMTPLSPSDLEAFASRIRAKSANADGSVKLRFDEPEYYAFGAAIGLLEHHKIITKQSAAETLSKLTSSM